MRMHVRSITTTRRSAGTLALAATAALALAAPAAAQVPVVTEGPIHVSVTGRGQFQFNTTSVDGEPSSTFEQRRVRLGAITVVDDWITTKLEAEYAMGKLAVKDAWIDLGFDRAFAVRVGQFKKPFGRIELMSSTKLVPIEFGLRIRGVPSIAEHYDLLEDNGYAGRDLGAELHGELGPLGWAVGAFNGEGADARDVNGDKSFAGRLDLAPLGGQPLGLGVDVSYRETGGVLPDSTVDGAVVGADIQWGGFRLPGPTLTAEFMTGRNLTLDTRMMGAQGILSWFFPTGRSRIEGVEPLFRASWGDPDTDLADDSGVLLTPGINFYFYGRNRFMLDWDLYSAGPNLDFFSDTAGARAVRAQMSFFF